MKLITRIKKINRSYHRLIDLVVIVIAFIAVTSVTDYMVTARINTVTDLLEASNKQLLISESRMAMMQDSLSKELELLKATIAAPDTRKFKVTGAANIIREYRTKMTDGEAMRLAGMIYDVSENNGMTYSMVLAIIATESRFNPNVGESSAGAKGICQMMPQTFAYVASAHGYNFSENDVMDLSKNLKVGIAYMRDLYKRYHGSLNMVAAGYNGGPRVAMNWAKYADGDTTVYIPEETKKYVVKVNEYYTKYRQILGE